MMDSRTVAALLACVAFAAAQTVVNIPSLGSLQGTTGQSYFTNRTFYQFLGVPFAERPVRFMPPTKKAAWEGVLNATSHGQECPQASIMMRDSSTDPEDCLFLDVYSPNVSTESKMPVMVYIHGGAFVIGSSQMVSPGFLMEKDVVLVAPQYRLGALGYLSLRNEEIPGNAAMFDQVMALQWVYDNIQNFGGDPEQITITGVSAGAASASLLYVSPLTQGLISKVMLFSGSAVSLIAVGTDPVYHSLGIAKNAGCENNDQLVSCLQNVDSQVLVEATTNWTASQKATGHSGMGGTQTIVDGKFLPAMPLDILQNASFKALPMLATSVKHEGFMIEGEFAQNIIQGYNLTNNFLALKYEVPDIMLSYADTKDTACTIGTAIADEYFKPGQLGNYTAMQAGIVDFLGAAYFKGPARKLAELNHLRGGPTYLGMNYYSLQHNGLVPHGSDQSLYFPSVFRSYTEEDLRMSQNLTTIITNFVTTGVPSGVSWEQYSVETGTYLLINSISELRSPFEQEYFAGNRDGL